MRRRCGKGKPCGATCIERGKECLKEAGASIAKSLGSVRNSVKARSATYKIAKSASPAALEKMGVPKGEAQSMRKTQLQARKVLNKLRDEGDSVIKTNGLAKEKDINWRSILGSDVRAVGSGDFGSFASLPAQKALSPEGVAKVAEGRVGIKVGKIGPNEVEAIRRAGEADLGPRLVGARVSPIVKQRHKIDGSDGAVAMTIVPGRPYRSSPKDIGGFPKSEMYWEAIAALHKLGIAHNDLHGGNIIIDSTGPAKARIVDFGLAQLSHKAALAEALGALSGTNFQFAAEKNRGHALTVKANLPYIEQLLIDKGLSNREISTILQGGIRKKDKFFNLGAWAKLTEEEAKGLVNDLYEGVVD